MTGDAAAVHAAQHVDELIAEGDLDRHEIWLRIERAIDELQRTERRGDEPLS